MSDADLPGVYQSASREARRWKSLFLWLYSSQLVLLYTGAVAGAASRYGAAEQLTLLSLICFLIVAALRLLQRFTTVSDRWPAARQVAERTKSLAWSYAVGAVPFERDSGTDGEAQTPFKTMLREVFEAWRWRRDAPEWSEQVTPAMRQLRERPLVDRKNAYAAGRIDDQVAWYTAKARRNARSATGWDLAFAAISVAAIGGGTLQIAGRLDFDILRLGGFAAALIVSWTGLNRHKRQAKVYRMTADELEGLGKAVSAVETEAAWSHLVDRFETTLRHESRGWYEARN